MKEVYTNIVRNLRDDSFALQLVQKLLTNSIGEREISLFKRPATYFFNYLLSSLLETMLF